MTRMSLLLALSISLPVPSCKSKEEVLRAEQESARFETERGARKVEGVAGALKGSGTKAITALSESVGSLMRGAEKGIETSSNVVVKAPRLEALGVKVSRAGAHPKKARTLSAYLVFDKAWPQAGKLRLRALDGAGGELGRSLAELPAQQAGGASYVDFELDERMPSASVAIYEIEPL